MCEVIALETISALNRGKQINTLTLFILAHPDVLSEGSPKGLVERVLTQAQKALFIINKQVSVRLTRVATEYVFQSVLKVSLN